MLLKARFLSLKVNSQWSRRVWGTKEGHSDQRAILDSEGGPGSTVTSSPKPVVLCPYHSPDTYHTLFCRLWKVFLNSPALVKSLKAEHIFVPHYLSLKLQEKLVFNWRICPKVWAFFYQVGVWARLKCIWGKRWKEKEWKLIVSFGHIAFLDHFTRSPHSKTNTSYLKKVQKPRAVKHPIILNSNNTLSMSTHNLTNYRMHENATIQTTHRHCAAVGLTERVIPTSPVAMAVRSSFNVFFIVEGVWFLSYGCR